MSAEGTLIEWEGTSYRDLMTFPVDARRSVGFQLGRLQIGLEPTDWKPLTGLSKEIQGIKEVRVWPKDGGYRVAYVMKFREASNRHQL